MPGRFPRPARCAIRRHSARRADARAAPFTDAPTMTTDLTDTLAAAAADTGGRYEAAGLQELLEGVVAAPAALDESEWMELAVPGATEAQAKRLHAARA